MVRTGLVGKTLVCLVAIVCASAPAEAEFLSRKQAKRSPRGRIACMPSPTMGTRYLDADDLGKHSYGFTLWEQNGIIYTCRGGHVDVTHLRKVADWTGYLAYHIHDMLMKDRMEMSCKMWEPSKYHLRLEYPSGWQYLPLKSRDTIIREVAIDLASYLAYTASVWHEILTWHGFKGAGIYPEYQSAFSWEDNYSNAMGSYVAALALRDCDREFNQAVTWHLDREIQRLGGQPMRVARQAGEAVRELWFKGGYVVVTMVKRHLDIGLDDGWITPWLVPGMTECPDEQPQPCPVPSLKHVERYGFRVSVEIEPKEWEKREILKKAYPDPQDRRDRIDPTKHLAAIIEAIRAETIERYGPRADEYEIPAHLARIEASRSVAEPQPSSDESHQQSPPSDAAGDAELVHDR